MYIKIIDEQEKRALLKNYSVFINKTALRKFAKKSGYGQEYEGVTFKENMIPEWEWEQELNDIKDNQVVLQVVYPATISDDKNAEENVYIDFDEFYNYLVEVVDKRISENPEDKVEYQELLAKIKIALEL
ncbi:MAG: hypothetical protein GX453_09710 [Lactococcus chungangensis]|uniref:Uncharacterized protein n=1 Tax=Pseudolactococcus chungangensis TaxID=451457 RepID=A0A847J612_9LACT|nr:hypothetical protein [Lactococcus chungangensis]